MGYWLGKRLVLFFEIRNVDEGVSVVLGAKGKLCYFDRRVCMER